MIKETAGIFLVNKDNKILVIHPTNHANDVWSIPKGYIDKKENSLAAAIRELEEETSLKFNEVKIDKIHGEISITYKTGKKVLKAYIAHTSENLYDYPFRCDSMVYYMNRKRLKIPFPECDDFKWVTLEEAEKILHESQVKVLNLI